MGGLGAHMVGLTQLYALEIYFLLTFVAYRPIWRTL